MELDSKLKEEIELAKKVRKNAYVPYSNFKVGAVLKTKKGKTYTGCNIENNGIQSICAERVAFCKALSEGEKEFESILVIGGYNEEIAMKEECLPCGYCRQFISEFVNKDFNIYTICENNVKAYQIGDLLPYVFKLDK